MANQGDKGTKRASEYLGGNERASKRRDKRGKNRAQIGRQRDPAGNRNTANSVRNDTPAAGQGHSAGTYSSQSHPVNLYDDEPSAAPASGAHHADGNGTAGGNGKTTLIQSSSAQRTSHVDAAAHGEIRGGENRDGENVSGLPAETKAMWAMEDDLMDSLEMIKAHGLAIKFHIESEQTLRAELDATKAKHAAEKALRMTIEAENKTLKVDVDSDLTDALANLSVENKDMRLKLEAEVERHLSSEQAMQKTADTVEQEHREVTDDLKQKIADLKADVERITDLKADVVQAEKERAERQNEILQSSRNLPGAAPRVRPQDLFVAQNQLEAKTDVLYGVQQELHQAKQAASDAQAMVKKQKGWLDKKAEIISGLQQKCAELSQAADPGTTNTTAKQLEQDALPGGEKKKQESDQQGPAKGKAKDAAVKAKEAGGTDG